MCVCVGGGLKNLPPRCQLCFESKTGYHFFKKAFLGQELSQAFGVPVAHPAPSDQFPQCHRCKLKCWKPKAFLKTYKSLQLLLVPAHSTLCASLVLWYSVLGAKIWHWHRRISVTVLIRRPRGKAQQPPNVNHRHIPNSQIKRSAWSSNGHYLLQI